MTIAALETVSRHDRRAIRGAQSVTLLDLLDRLLEGGVVVQGDITLAVADIDLVNLSLRLVVAAASTVERDARRLLPDGAR